MGFAGFWNFKFWRIFLRFVSDDLERYPYVSFPDSLIQMLYRIDFQLWEIIHQVIPQVKFAFRDDPMYLTYFLTKSRSNLVFAFLARIRAYFASLMFLLITFQALKMCDFFIVISDELPNGFSTELIIM